MNQTKVAEMKVDPDDPTRLDPGPLVTPQMIIGLLFVVVVVSSAFYFGRDVPQPKESPWGKYKSGPIWKEAKEETKRTKEEQRLEVENLPNRKNEVEAATKDVDFQKYDYQVQLDTTFGTILLDLWPDVAPNHCLNMIGLTRIGFYDGLKFHRVVPSFVCQTGCPLGNGRGGPGYTIDEEFNNKKHFPGVLSMARSQSPNSAGSQFFICLDRAEHLDAAYTAFGQTADQESLDNVLKFNNVKVINQEPQEELVLNSATVIAKAKK